MCSILDLEQKINTKEEEKERYKSGKLLLLGKYSENRI